MPEFGPIRNHFHVHLVDHSTRVGCSILFAVLHRADESQPARNSCPQLPHSVDSQFGLYHAAVVLSFLRSPISRAETLPPPRSSFDHFTFFICTFRAGFLRIGGFQNGENKSLGKSHRTQNKETTFKLIV